MIFLGLLLLILGVFLEGAYIALPFSLSLLIVLLISYRSVWVLFVACLAGILLDTLLFRDIGASAVYFLGVLLLILLYDKRFEVRTLPFVLASTVFGVSGYLLVFGHRAFFAQTLAGVIIGVCLFLVFGGVRREEGALRT